VSQRASSRSPTTSGASRARAAAPGSLSASMD
jgi:hypothetical protein